MSRQIIRSAFEQSFSFWPDLTPEDQTYLLDSTTHLFLPKGMSIYHEPSSLYGVFFIVSGGFRIYLLTDAGRDITLYRLGSGQIGYMLSDGILGEVLFSVNVETEMNSELFTIRPSAYELIRDRYLQAQHFTYRLTNSRFSDILWTFQQLLLYSFDKRLAIFLIDELTRTGGDTIHYSQEQIAKYVGSAREVVSRMLKYFAREGLIEVGRGGIRVLDKQRLRALAVSTKTERASMGKSAK